MKPPPPPAVPLTTKNNAANLNFDYKMYATLIHNEYGLFIWQEWWKKWSQTPVTCRRILSSYAKPCV